MNIDSCVFLPAALSLELSLCSSCVSLELPLTTGVRAHPALAAGLWSTLVQVPPWHCSCQGVNVAHGAGATEQQDSCRSWLRCELKPYVKLIAKINPSNYFIIV